MYSRRMKVNAVVRKECAHLALEAVRYRGGISKACGHGLKKSSCPHDPSTNYRGVYREVVTGQTMAKKQFATLSNYHGEGAA